MITNCTPHNNRKRFKHPSLYYSATVIASTITVAVEKEKEGEKNAVVEEEKMPEKKKNLF